MRLQVITACLTFCLAATSFAAPDQRKPIPPDDASDIADKLTERIDLDRFEKVPLHVALEVLQDKLGCSILLDYKLILPALGEDSIDRKVLEQRAIDLPAMKHVRIETILRYVLDQINSDFYIAQDHIHVS